MQKIRKTVKSWVVFDHYAFKRFIKKHPKYADEIKNISEYKRLLMLVQNRAIRELQENPHGIIFPDSNCVLFINNKGVMQKKAIDFNLSRKYNTRIYHTNISTNQNIMKITYLNRIFPSSVENSDLYSFFPKRNFRKTCSDFFKANYNKCLTYGKKYGIFNN